jgi:LacI family transcriptional regulator
MRPLNDREVFFSGVGSDAHSQRILEGIVQYSLEQPEPWRVSWGGNFPDLDNMRPHEKPLGVIVFGTKGQQVASLRKHKIPIVKVGTMRWQAKIPHVVPDNQAIGFLAARHFLERRHRDFAFVGEQTHLYSCERLEGFLQGCAPHSVSVCQSLPAVENEGDVDRKLKGFLAGLPVGCAIFAINDIYARRVVWRLRELGLRVPQERALLGVDNDHLFLMQSHVGISSIDPDSKEIGYRAAERLHRLMQGLPDDGKAVRIPPKEVVLRASSDWMHSNDETISLALRLIRSEACAGMEVSDLCKRLGLGRRMFERRFHEVAGIGPDTAIRRARLEQACQLLAGTTLRVGEISQRTGYVDALYFSRAFRKATGKSPREWRALPAKQRPAITP